MLTNKNGSRFCCFDLLPNGSVPGASGSNILFIQPRFDIFLGELLCNLTDDWLVLAVVAQEDIKDFRLWA